MEEREAYIALNMVQRIGAATVANGVEALGSAVAFFKAGEPALRKVRGISRDSAEKLSTAFALTDWKREIERAGKCHTKLVTFADPGYPPLLKTIHNPPLVLYVTGDPSAFSLPCVGIVGTRAPTPYGRANAATFASALARAGYAVVSGLARGIDTEAHRATLAAQGVTVAVLGAALDKLYPEENRKLAHKIVENGGAVISEYPFGRAGDKQTFPFRNRVISGLSQGVLVVEADTHSGTLITADHALEQGRSVMAIPGRIDSAAAAGCHKLIQDGARLVTTPGDVLDELSSLSFGAMSPTVPYTPPAPDIQLDDDEKTIISVLQDGDMTLDELSDSTNIPARKLVFCLTTLEMKSLVDRPAPDRVKLRKKR